MLINLLHTFLILHPPGAHTDRPQYHPWRGCRDTPVPAHQEACQARRAPGRQLPPDRHSRQQLPELQH